MYRRRLSSSYENEHRGFETPLTRGEIPDVSLLDDEETAVALREANLRRRALTIEKLRLIDEVNRREERVLLRQIEKLNHRLVAHDKVITNNVIVISRGLRLWKARWTSEDLGS